MRFHYGAVPEDPNFNPHEDGWRGIREPGPVAIQLLAIPVALGVLALLSFVVVNIAPGIGGPTNRIQLAFGLPDSEAGNLTRAVLFLGKLLLFFAGLLALIFVHELVHALLTPFWGQTPRTLVAVWPQKLLFYAHYLDALPRNQFLLVCIGPLLVLTVLPLIIVAILAQLPGTAAAQGWLAAIAVFNGVSASGDIIGFFLVLLQIPANAVVRNQGWHSYWKPAGHAGG